VAIEYISAQGGIRPMTRRSVSLGLYVGILADFAIDGAVIGVGSTLTLATGLLLALGLAVGSAPLAFVTTATAKRQGVSAENRRLLSILYIACMIAGAMFGYLLLRGQPLGVRMVLVAFAAGFLFATVTQGILPEAGREDAPNLSGLLYVGGLSLYALMSLGVK
jgi:zinc transporter ZupT